MPYVGTDGVCGGEPLRAVHPDRLTRRTYSCADQVRWCVWGI